MKKFLVFLIVGGSLAAAWWFYDPHLKPFVEPWLEKAKESAAGQPSSPSPDQPASSQPSAKPGAPNAPAADPAAKSPTPGTVTKVPASPEEEIDRLVAERYPYPEILPLLRIVDDWNNIPAKAYPTEVTILEKVPFTLKAPNGQVIGSSDAPPGTPVAPLRIQGEMLMVASLANRTMVSEIALDKTDFKDRVQNHYDAFVANTRRRVDGVRAKARQNLLANATALDALRASGAVQWDSKDDPRFGPVKASLANGDVKAFSLEEAVSFKWNGSERIDGDLYKGTYDTVTVKYEAQTIFGRFPGEVKCLLQAGQVKGWIDPVTMEEKI